MKAKNLLLLVVLLALLLISVGYSSFSSTLPISGVSSFNGTWDIQITSVELLDSSNGLTDESILNYNNENVNCNPCLSYPGASAKYIITVENKGTIDAILNTLSSNKETQKYIDKNGLSFEIIPEHEPLTFALKPGNTEKFTVIITWNENATSIPENFSLEKMQIDLNYVQYT